MRERDGGIANEFAIHGERSGQFRKCGEIVPRKVQGLTTSSLHCQRKDLYSDPIFFLW